VLVDSVVEVELDVVVLEVDVDEDKDVDVVVAGASSTRPISYILTFVLAILASTS
jgi:hypothetical protein